MYQFHFLIISYSPYNPDDPSLRFWFSSTNPEMAPSNHDLFGFSGNTQSWQYWHFRIENYDRCSYQSHQLKVQGLILKLTLLSVHYEPLNINML